VPGKTVKVKCACGCGTEFEARVADRKRGWGKFATKSCKAKAQERRTHQHRDYRRRQETYGVNMGTLEHTFVGPFESDGQTPW